MKKTFVKNLKFVVTATVVVTTQIALAADLAEAAGDMAEISTLSVQAKKNLVDDALGGNIDAIAESTKRSDAVDAAVAQGQEAQSEIVKAVQGGDNDAADSAADDLKSAVQKARDALDGVIPEPSATSKHAAWKKSQENTGGGPGRAYDPPNIYNDPSMSQGLQSFYQGLFGNFWGSSAFGDSRGFGERDATPE